MDYLDVLRKNLLDSIAAKKQFLGNDEQLDIFSRAVNTVVQRYRAGGRLYIAGNGGSAADAQHLAAEFVSKLARDRAPRPADALTVNSSILTAIGNDYGYEQIFSRQIAGKVTGKDVFLDISTSGQSRNILRALEQCRAMGVPSIVFCGRDGGPADGRLLHHRLRHRDEHNPGTAHCACPYAVRMRRAGHFRRMIYSI